MLKHLVKSDIYAGMSSVATDGGYWFEPSIAHQVRDWFRSAKPPAAAR